MQSQNIGFVGIGAMGTGMVANLRKSGFPVTFYARDTARGRENAARLEPTGARAVSELDAVGNDADIVILCLPDSPAVESTLSDGAGLTPFLRKGAIVVDCSTSFPESTRRLAAQLKPRGITLLDGPLTGSRPQAEAGTLNILGAGPLEVFDKARPVLEAFSANVFHLGETGAGHTAKLINNYFGLLALAGLCETWALIKRYGLDPQAFFEAISVSGGNSPTFQGAFPRFRKGDGTVNFTQKLARKDIRYLKELTQNAEIPAPLAASLLSIHELATAKGYGDHDVTGLLEFYQEFTRSSDSAI